MTDLEVLGRLYEAPELQPSQFVRVKHDLFRSFYFALARLQRELREREIADPYVSPLLRILARFRFDAATTPLAFRDQPSWIDPGRLHQFSLGFAQSHPQIQDLATLVLDLYSGLSGLDENPLLFGLSEALDRKVAKVAVALVHPRAMRRVGDAFAQDPRLKRVRVLSQDELRADHWFDQLLLVGAPRWYYRLVLDAPRAAVISCVYYGWTGGRVSRHPLFGSSISDLEAHASAMGAPLGAEEDEAEALSIDDLVLDAVSTGALLADLHRQVAGDSHGGTDRDVVPARAFVLEGGRGVFLEADESASALVLDLEEVGRKRVHRLPVSELREGSVVVLRASGGGDYVVPVADQLLAHQAGELRGRQSEWKALLRTAMDVRGLGQLCADLQHLGGHLADEGNVRRWIAKRSIRPSQRGDFHAIMLLVGREADEERFWRAMEQIDRAHLRAGQLIRKALIDRVRVADGKELAGAGYVEFDLPGMDVARMVACRIVGLGGDLTFVDGSNVSRIFILEDE